MEISRERTLALARMAHLELTEDEADLFTEDLCDILDYIDAIAEVEVEGVEPTTHAAHLAAALREDAPAASLTRAQVMANAPAMRGECFEVPRVLAARGGEGGEASWS